MSHNLDVPIAHAYRGQLMYLKFAWTRPNDTVPTSVKVVESGTIDGLGEVAAELSGPWLNYPEALSEAMATAERWIDSQLA